MDPSRSEERGSSGCVHGRQPSPPLLPQVKQQQQQPAGAAAAWASPPPRTRMQVWFIRVCSGILVWTCLVQLLTVGQLWHRPHFFSSASGPWNPHRFFGELARHFSVQSLPLEQPPSLSPILPARIYKSNGYLKISCNGGLNQMRAAICDMVTVARLLNLTLVVPELDKKSFWADPSDFDDIFDVKYFIDSLRDEVHIIKRVPKRLTRINSNSTLIMSPVSWSKEEYYLKQILPLFSKYEVIHFNKTDARLTNNGLSLELQKLRCRVNYHALKFNDPIEALGQKLINKLQERGNFIALHLRYEMDMLAFSGCTHGCSPEEADELKRMRYAYPWWREKEIVSDQKRLQGLCPLTPEETALVLKALGFQKDIQIYIASGETYGSERRLGALHKAFPQLVKKEMLLDPKDLWQFQNHSSQMAALDYMVAVASDIFIPTFDGNMAKVVEGHRRYLGFGKSILLDRRKLVELLDLHENKTISWNKFAETVRLIHEKKMGQPGPRTIIANKPKEEDYFYANPEECLCDTTAAGNMSVVPTATR